MAAPDAVIDALVSWATSHGAALHPSVHVYRDARTGLSFRVKPDAPAPLEPCEPVVHLPTALAFSYLNARDQPRPLPEPFLAAAPPHVVGRVLLVSEHLAGRQSFWWPYLQALPSPSEPETWALAPFWPSDDAELLEGTNVEVGMHKITRDVAAELHQARQLLSSSPAPGPALARAMTPTLYHWAYCVFSSRSFRPALVLSDAQRAALASGVSIDDFSVLLPLFDIGNHDMTTDVRWHLDQDSSTCELHVARSYAPGQQIFNNYSLKTNAELLLGYGFMLPVTDDLHNDYIHVRKRTATAPVPEDEHLISLRPLSHPSSLLVRSRQKLHLDPDTKLLGAFQHLEPDMVWGIFCTLSPPDQHDRLIPAPDRVGDDAERHRRHCFFSGQVDGEARFYLEQTVALVQHKVLQELERLDETEVEVPPGQADMLTPNQRLALDYRQRCRLVLENVLEAISQDDILVDEDEDGGDDQ